ncbi:hypothetical protein MHBO_001686 [Bonamia ostreae]|uniref:Uncharacterized protein n=1 Tax=Bonamia ostreae TaxID=126728 RepID=A0ABV2AKE2_9EUKA
MFVPNLLRITAMSVSTSTMAQNVKPIYFVGNEALELSVPKSIQFNCEHSNKRIQQTRPKY